MTVDPEEIAKVVEGEADELRDLSIDFKADPAAVTAVAEQLEHVADRLREEGEEEWK